MEKQDYEKLINQGFRIIRHYKGDIQIKVKKAGWAKVSAYSPERWQELLEHGKTIEDY